MMTLEALLEEKSSPLSSLTNVVNYNVSTSGQLTLFRNNCMN